MCQCHILFFYILEDEEKTIILLGLVADMVFTEIHDRCIHEKRMLLATVI